MSKVKKAPKTNTLKKNIFYYEILGIVLTFISLFSFAKLGKLGLYLSLSFKLMFGDWYFMFIIIMLGVGVYYLLRHQALNVTSLTFIGCLLIFTSFITLSHFSMHDYIKNYSNKYISTTLSLYIDYFKNSNSSSIVGGGIVGMLVFYLFYYLLSSVGVIVICICFIILGVCFILKKTLWDIVNLIKDILKKVVLFIQKRIINMKKGLTSIGDEFSQAKKKELFNEVIDKTPRSNNDKYVVGHINELKNKVMVCISKLGLFDYELESMITPQILKIIINSVLVLDINKIENSLYDEIHESFLIKVDDTRTIITIEFSNPYAYTLSLSSIVNELVINHLLITLDNENDYVYLSYEISSIILFDESLRTMLFYLVESCMCFNNTICIDLTNELKLYSNSRMINEYYGCELVKKDNEKESYVVDILNTFIARIEEANSTNTLINSICFINVGIDDELSTRVINKIFKRLRYLVEISKERNIIYVIRLNKYYDNDTYLYNSVDYIMNCDSKDYETMKFFSFCNLSLINIGYEALLKDKDIVLRCQGVSILDSELKKLK